MAGARANSRWPGSRHARFRRAPSHASLEASHRNPWQEMTDGKLGRAEAGQVAQRLHRQIEMAFAVERYILGKHDRSKAVLDTQRQFVQPPPTACSKLPGMAHAGWLPSTTGAA